MINFILPNGYFYLELNNKFIDLVHFKQSFFKNQLNFIGINANFPFNIWNGGTLINDSFLNKEEIENLYNNKITKPLIIDCSNIFISATDVFNLKENIFLQKYHTGLNYIIISDPNFLLLLKNKYPYYSFILSPYFPKEEITEDLINNCTYIINYYNAINENIPKNKVIVMFPTNKNCYICDDFIHCSKKEQENIYKFKTISQFRTCLKDEIENNYQLNIFDYQKYIEQGYINFQFDDRAFPLKNNQLMAHFYSDFFAKQEYNQEVFNYLMEG